MSDLRSEWIGCVIASIKYQFGGFSSPATPELSTRRLLICKWGCRLTSHQSECVLWQNLTGSYFYAKHPPDWARNMNTVAGENWSFCVFTSLLWLWSALKVQRCQNNIYSKVLWKSGLRRVSLKQRKFLSF